MKVIYLKDSRELTYFGKDAVREIHRIADRELTLSKNLTIDMDGVQVFDDASKITAEILAGEPGLDYFLETAKDNINAVEKGDTAYCWNVAQFMAYLLKGNSTEFNRNIGRSIRLIPDTQIFIEYVKQLEYNVVSVTASNQETAEEVAKRIGIEQVLGNLYGRKNEVYDGTIKRFVGGKHKASIIEELFSENLHIGDSWSDIESLENNGLALNPTNKFVMMNAKVSVITSSLMSLLPFLDDKGIFDDVYLEEQLPDTVIISEGDFSQELLYSSTEFKHQRICKLLPGLKLNGDLELVKREIPDFNFSSFVKEEYERFVK